MEGHEDTAKPCDSTAYDYRYGLQQYGEYIKACYKEFDLISCDLSGFCI